MIRSNPKFSPDFCRRWNPLFSNPELARYSRRLIIVPEFNIEGQLKLKNAKVVVVGAGGLGSPMLLYLAAAGLSGRSELWILTRWRITTSERQCFGVRDIGQSKAQAAKSRILDLNPFIHVIVHEVALRADDALEIIRDYDVVAERGPTIFKRATWSMMLAFCLAKSTFMPPFSGLTAKFPSSTC